MLLPFVLDQSCSVASCSPVCIVFGAFLCFPGITITATGASYIVGPICLGIGFTLVVIGASCCYKVRKNTRGVGGAPVVATTIFRQEPYVVEQGVTMQNDSMQTNIYPTTTIYQPQTSNQQHSSPAMPPTGQGQGFPESHINAGYSPTNPGYPPTGYPAQPSQGFSPVPPSYNDVVGKDFPQKSM